MPPVPPSGYGDLSATTQAADRLLNEGRYAQALTLYDHLLQHDPGNLVAAINAAQAASQQDDHVDALRRAKGFGAISQLGIDPGPYIAHIKARATAAFNASAGADNLDHAAAIIDGLIALDPGAYLSAGLSVAQALGKTELIADYAGRLLQINPANWYAHLATSEIAKQRGDTALWLYHATRAILLRPWTAADQALSVSSIAYYCVADILAHPECPEALGYVDELRHKVSAITQTFPDESDRAFDEFIRVSLDAIDTSILDIPLTEDAPPQPDLTFADAAGEAMTVGQWTQRLQALSPRVIFLASADEIYLQRYGRNYVRSMLERCDVDCAVIMGVVGEAGRLKSLIEAIGVTDPRLFYLVDAFNPAHAVSCYSTTARRTGCATAYYQSFRFLVLDYLLASLQLPFIVTDIDLHLQGSVAGVLEQHTGRDVVLNRNAQSASYGARFTANLALFRPSRTARQFARTLRLCLEQSLRRQHVEQFVDQTAFSLADYGCRRQGLTSFGDFRENEINNVMLNRAGMEPGVADLARSFVFLAYYGSQGDSAEALMQATAPQARDVGPDARPDS
jgi:tetratricopeptide (TPR) repeat protein